MAARSDDADLAATAGRIDANPLGRIMHGHRELFHTNMLAWFFEHMPSAADEVFRRYAAPGEGGPRRVERERQHLDLVMHWPGRGPLAIEHKVFALPDATQLARYEELTDAWPEPPAKVLLSAIPLGAEAGGWVWLGHAELGALIVAALESDRSWEAETMRRYAALIGDIEALAVRGAGTVRLDDPVWPAGRVLEALPNPQLRTALQKLRAHCVAVEINRGVPGLAAPAHGDMSRATPLVEVLARTRADGYDVKLGWQLQGGQFRRSVTFLDESLVGRTAEARDRRVAVAREHPEWFAMPVGDRHGHDGRGEYNHFDPDFLYRYVKVPELSVRQLLEAAREVDEQVRGLAGR